MANQRSMNLLIVDDNPTDRKLLRMALQADNAKLIAKLEEKNLQLTRQTEASRQAEEHNRALAAIVESSDDAIMSTSLDETILIWNAGATRLFGYTAEEAIGKSISIIVPADRQQEREALMTRMRRGERFTNVETVRVRKDGSRVDVSIHYSKVRNDQGKIVAVSVISRDITERKRAEESCSICSRHGSH